MAIVCMRRRRICSVLPVRLGFPNAALDKGKVAICPPNEHVSLQYKLREVSGA